MSSDEILYLLQDRVFEFWWINWISLENFCSTCKYCISFPLIFHRNIQENIVRCCIKQASIFCAMILKLSIKFSVNIFLYQNLHLFYCFILNAFFTSLNYIWAWSKDLIFNWYPMWKEFAMSSSNKLCEFIQNLLLLLIYAIKLNFKTKNVLAVE